MYANCKLSSSKTPDHDQVNNVNEFQLQVIDLHTIGPVGNCMPLIVLISFYNFKKTKQIGQEPTPHTYQA